jgi:hypothetical protein
MNKDALYLYNIVIGDGRKLTTVPRIHNAKLYACPPKKIP